MAVSTVTEKTSTSSIVVILSMVTVMGAVGKHTAMAQSSCNSGLVSLAPCLNYITGNDTTPAKGCCSALASVVKINAPCLCQLLRGNNPVGIPVNRTRALALPGECKVTTPPVSQCQGAGAPTSPSATDSPSGSGTPTRQATPGSNPTQTNAGSGIFRSSVINVVAGTVLAAVLS